MAKAYSCRYYCWYCRTDHTKIKWLGFFGQPPDHSKCWKCGSKAQFASCEVNEYATNNR